MQDELIAIKGIKDGLLININTTEEWLSITEELATHIDGKADFFAGANVTVDLGNRPVPKYELSSLKALLERRKLTLTVVLSDSETTNQSAIALDMRTETGNVVPGREAQETIPTNSEETGTHGVLFRRTLRSGRTIHSDGHVIVYGDVNPGAKIIAIGDIIVWGKLRGTVHAGAEGDESAIICALDMSPNQLRIASYIVTSPPGKRGDVYPEVALIRNNQIVVEARD